MQKEYKARGKEFSWSWEQLVEELRGRFGENAGIDVDTLMKRLYQRSTVEEYIEEFQCLMYQVKLEDKTRLSYLLEGLRPNQLQVMVKMFEPRDVYHAFKLAHLYSTVQSPSVNYNLGNVQKIMTVMDKGQKNQVTNRPLSSVKPVNKKERAFRATIP